MSIPSILCLHGAANGAWVWDTWRRHLAPLGWEVNVLDLRGHGRSLPVDYSTLTMDDYVADVDSVVRQIAAHDGMYPVLMGWSMGGLIAMMSAAITKEIPALALFAPSPPLEVAGRVTGDEVRKTPSGPFGPEVYGIFPDDLEKSRNALFDLSDEQASRVLASSSGALESGFARRQRKRGISVPADDIQCPSIVIFGEQDGSQPPEQCRKLATYLDATTIALPALGHWGILYDEEAVARTAVQLDGWLRKIPEPSQAE